MPKFSFLRIIFLIFPNRVGRWRGWGWYCYITAYSSISYVWDEHCLMSKRLHFAVRRYVLCSIMCWIRCWTMAKIWEMWLIRCIPLGIRNRNRLSRAGEILRTYTHTDTLFQMDAFEQTDSRQTDIITTAATGCNHPKMWIISYNEEYGVICSRCCSCCLFFCFFSSILSILVRNPMYVCLCAT